MLKLNQRCGRGSTWYVQRMYNVDQRNVRQLPGAVTQRHLTWCHFALFISDSFGGDTTQSCRHPNHWIVESTTFDPRNMDGQLPDFRQAAEHLRGLATHVEQCRNIPVVDNGLQTLQLMQEMNRRFDRLEDRLDGYNRQAVVE